MPNPYHDPKTGRFASKAGGDVTAGWAASFKAGTFEKAGDVASGLAGEKERRDIEKAVAKGPGFVERQQPAIDSAKEQMATEKNFERKMSLRFSAEYIDAYRNASDGEGNVDYWGGVLKHPETGVALNGSPTNRMVTVFEIRGDNAHDWLDKEPAPAEGMLKYAHHVIRDKKRN